MRLPAQFGNLYVVQSSQATCLHCNYCFAGRMRRAQIKIAIKHWSGRIFSSTRSFSKVVFEKFFKTLFRKTKKLFYFGDSLLVSFWNDFWMNSLASETLVLFWNMTKICFARWCRYFFLILHTLTFCRPISSLKCLFRTKLAMKFWPQKETKMQKTQWWFPRIFQAKLLSFKPKIKPLLFSQVHKTPVLKFGPSWKHEFAALYFFLRIC